MYEPGCVLSSVSVLLRKKTEGGVEFVERFVFTWFLGGEESFNI